MSLLTFYQIPIKESMFADEEKKNEDTYQQGAKKFNKDINWRKKNKIQKYNNGNEKYTGRN